MFRVWHSTKGVADWLVENTDLKQESVNYNKIYESDANNPRNFHKVPTHLKNILYLDAPDLIVEFNHKPIFSLEISTGAGTGHNVFQRFARIAASVENKVPAFYVFPEAVYIRRKVRRGWDKLNPLIFEALEKTIRIYNIPALMYYFPSHYGSSSVSFSPASKGLIFDSRFRHCPNAGSGEMLKMFRAMNAILKKVKMGAEVDELMGEREIDSRRDFMLKEMHAKMRGRGTGDWSPLSATETIPTEMLLKHLRKYAGRNYQFVDMISQREQSLVYKVDAAFRGDPYPGALAALDYLKCRKGKSYEERNLNLVMAWGSLSVENNEIKLNGDDKRSVETFMGAVRKTYSSPRKVILEKRFNQLAGHEIPRYFMQVRFGSTFTKVKHVRVYSYFCDALLFPDGALWKEG